MRFFSREWHSGGLPDAECDELTRRYREEHLPAILPRLPHALAELARGRSGTGEPLGIHDARIRGVVLALGDARVALELRTVGEPLGCADLDLEFREVDMARLDRSLLQRIAHDPQVELLYDEVDLATDGRCSWRVLLWPGYETLEISFREFAWRRRSQTGGILSRASAPYLELP